MPVDVNKSDFLKVLLASELRISDLTFHITNANAKNGRLDLARYRGILKSACRCMMTSSNGNIFRVTGHLCGEFTQSPETRSFDVFFDLRLNKRLSKQSWGWWFETLSRPLWRHCNGSHPWRTNADHHAAPVLHDFSICNILDRSRIRAVGVGHHS